MRSTPSLRSFPDVAIETVPVFVWLTMVLSRPRPCSFQSIDNGPLSSSSMLFSPTKQENDYRLEMTTLTNWIDDPNSDSLDDDL